MNPDNTYLGKYERAPLVLIELQLLLGGDGYPQLSPEPTVGPQLLPVHGKVGGTFGTSEAVDDGEAVQVGVEDFAV